MGKSRKDTIEFITSQRYRIRKYIKKYETYPYDRSKNFALDTISRCQERIEHAKNKCSSSIPDSYEDHWKP